MPNNPQVRLSQIYDCQTIFVDVYDEKSTRNPKDYGSGPFLVGVNENVLCFCNDYHLKIPQKNYRLIRLKNRMKYDSRPFLKIMQTSVRKAKETMKKIKFIRTAYYKLKVLFEK